MPAPCATCIHRSKRGERRCLERGPPGPHCNRCTRADRGCGQDRQDERAAQDENGDPDGHGVERHDEREEPRLRPAVTVEERRSPMERVVPTNATQARPRLVVAGERGRDVDAAARRDPADQLRVVVRVPPVGVAARNETVHGLEHHLLGARKQPVPLGKWSKSSRPKLVGRGSSKYLAHAMLARARCRTRRMDCHASAARHGRSRPVSGPQSLGHEAQRVRIAAVTRESSSSTQSDFAASTPARRALNRPASAAGQDHSKGGDCRLPPWQPRRSRRSSRRRRDHFRLEVAPRHRFDERLERRGQVRRLVVYRDHDAERPAHRRRARPRPNPATYTACVAISAGTVSRP